jgi:quercetin dioxygenase-like cupin family protein
MTKPALLEHGVAFELEAVDRELRAEDIYQRRGHSARTLVRQPDLRIVYMVMKAGAEVAEHNAQKTSSIHVLNGHVRLRLPDRAIDLSSGGLLVLEPGLAHDLEAVRDSGVLLTLGWKDGE